MDIKKIIIENAYEFEKDRFIIGKGNIDQIISEIDKALQLQQTGVSGSAYIDGCKYCKHNKKGFDAGSFCINNCVSGSKFEHKNL